MSHLNKNPQRDSHLNCWSSLRPSEKSRWDFLKLLIQVSIPHLDFLGSLSETFWGVSVRLFEKTRSQLGLSSVREMLVCGGSIFFSKARPVLSKGVFTKWAEVAKNLKKTRDGIYEQPLLVKLLWSWLRSVLLAKIIHTASRVNCSVMYKTSNVILLIYSLPTLYENKFLNGKSRAGQRIHTRHTLLAATKKINF